jgi:hypothetical protein
MAPLHQWNGNKNTIIYIAPIKTNWKKTPDRLFQLTGICAAMWRHSLSVSKHETTLYSLIVHITLSASVEHVPKQPFVHILTLPYRVKWALVQHGILCFEHNSLPGQWWCSWKVILVSVVRVYLHILKAPWARQSRVDSPQGDLFFCPERAHWLWVQPSLLYNRHQALFPKVQRPGRETDHSTQSSVQIKNA